MYIFHVRNVVKRRVVIEVALPTLYGTNFAITATLASFLGHAVFDPQLDWLGAGHSGDDVALEVPGLR